MKIKKPLLFIIFTLLLLVGIIAPTAYFLINSSNVFPFYNNTESTNIGARLSPAVLSMDFNQDGESYLNLPYQNRSLYEQGTYIKDGSVYNNFGISSGLTAQPWWNGNAYAGSNFKINGSLQFDGVDDYVNLTLPDLINWTIPSIPVKETIDGSYTVLTFISNATFNITQGSTDAEVLVVAGGGAGGFGAAWQGDAGGGGAGGLIYNSSYNISGNFNVVVGVGGNAIASGNGGNGANSTFGTLIAIGGGGGAKSGNSIRGNDGGSGGGGGGSLGTPLGHGNGIVGQGNRGGNTSASKSPGGGGGGAGLIGSDGTGLYDGGIGGNGTNYTINGSNVYYAGGGGGGGGYQCGNSRGAGGLGGGGNGGHSCPYLPTAGVPNTGGGGGGGAYSSAGVDGPGANGGSGVVIVRFLTGSINYTLSTNQFITVSYWYKNNTASNWTHVVINNNATTYVNGNVGTPNQNPINISGTTLKIGINQTSSFFNGSIDDVIIWGRALNSTEILGIYTEGLAGRTTSLNPFGIDVRIIPSDGRVAYFDFNNYTTGTNGNFTDRWNGYNLTLVATGPGLINYSTNGIFNSGYIRYDTNYVTSILPTPYLLNGTMNYTFAGWVNRNSTSGLNSLLRYPGSCGTSIGTFCGLYDYSAGRPIIAHKSIGKTDVYAWSDNPIPINDWSFIAGTFDANGTTGNLRLYINGVLVKSNLNNANLGTGLEQNSNFSLGSGGFNNFENGLDEVMIFNKTLNSSEIAGLYDFTRKKLHLQFDELSGTGAVNIGDSLANATLTNYPTTTAVTAPVYNATGGVNGSGAYVFDGIDDWISIPAFNLDNSFTISLWLKNSSTLSNGRFLTKYTSSTSMGMSCGQTGDIINCEALDKNGNNLSTIRAINCSTNIGKQFSAVYDYLKNNLSLYCNGVDGTIANTTGLFQLYTTSAKLDLGMVYPYGYAYNGTIDNVQIFNRALSASEIMNLYNGTYANRTIKYSTKQGDFTSGVFYNSSTSTYWNVSLATADTINRSGIINADNSINISNPNLVSYWPLDGNYRDAKGVNNGTAYNGVNNASGISSSAMRFDGVTSGITTTPNLPITNKTISLWLSSANTGTAQIAALYAGWYLYRPSGGSYIDFYGGAGCIGSGHLRGDTLTQSLWHYTNIIWVANYSGSYYNISFYDNNNFTGSILCNQSASPLTIGSGASGNWGWNGTIDEVLMYNTSLSASQVSQLYKSGLSQKARTNLTIQTRTASSYNISDPSLVAFWAFNNASGENSTYFKDELGRNNGTCSGATCPVINASSGVVSSGAWFDGSNDNITVVGYSGYEYNNFTISAWARTNSTDTYDGIVEYSNSGGMRRGIGFTNGNVVLTYGNTKYKVSTGLTVNNNQWHHIVGSYDGATTKMYVDGVNVSLSAELGASSGTVSTLKIGEWTLAGFRLAGLIDEVRIYNRSLSADEIMNLYNLGSYHISNWGAWSSKKTCYDNETKIEVIEETYCQEIINPEDEQIKLALERGDYYLYNNDNLIIKIDNPNSIGESGLAVLSSVDLTNTKKCYLEKWKLFKDLNESDKVATLNPSSGEKEYNLPSAYQEYDSPEFMYKIITEKGEMIVSPEHKVYSAFEKRESWKLFFGIVFIALGLMGLIRLLWMIKNEEKGGNLA